MPACDIAGESHLIGQLASGWAARRWTECEREDGPGSVREIVGDFCDSSGVRFSDRMRDTEDILLAQKSAGADTVLPLPEPLPEHAAGVALDGGGRPMPLGEAEDADFAPVERDVWYRSIAAAQAAYYALCESETGHVIPAEIHERRRKEREKLRRQSHSIASALEGVGVDAYRNTAWQLWRVGLHSGDVEAVPCFRNLCLIPWVAARNRQPLVAALEWWLERHPFARFWTFTGGQRCRVSELEFRVRQMHAKLSNLNQADFMRWAGAEIVFRSTELGTLEVRHESGGELEHDQGGAWYHPHMHCVVHLRNGPLAPAAWRQLLCDVWAFWGHYWDDDSLIRSPKECVKYVSKPGDVVSLAERAPAELRQLHEALFRLHLVQPMGELRRLMADWREQSLDLVRVSTPDGGVWELRRSVSRGWIHNGPAGVPHCAGGEMSESGFRRYAQRNHYGPTGADSPAPDVCRIVSWLAPAAGAAGVKEPRLVCLGTRLDLAMVERDGEVMQLRERTRGGWLAGLAMVRAEQAAGIRVHTGILIGSGGFLASIPERRRPPEVDSSA